jgi:hypothetical protein
MTSTNLSANPMPERIVLDIDAHEHMMAWLCDDHESLLYPALLECLKFEKDGEFELAYFLDEYRECHPDSSRFIPVLSRAAESLLTQIKQMHLYERACLNYEFDRLIPGAIVLVRLPVYRPADLEAVWTDP